MANCIQSLDSGLLSKAVLSGTCNVSDLANGSSSSYVAPIYEHQKLIPFFHAAPRFGRTNDIDNYVTDSHDEYVMGLRILAIIFWVILGLWCLCLLYRRLKRKGRMSGATPEKLNPERSPEELSIFDLELVVDLGDDGDANDQECVDPVPQRAKDRIDVKGFRVVVLVSGVLHLISSGMLLGIGFRDLDGFLKDTTTNLPNADGTVVLALNATSSFLSIFNSITAAKDELTSNVALLCNSSLNTSIGGVSVAGSSFSLNATIGDLSSTNNTMAFLQTNLADLSSKLSNADRTLRHFERWWFYLASALVLALDAIVIMFMIGTVLAWRRAQPRRLRNINNICLLPIFFVLVLTAYVVSTYALMVGEFIADFCIESPDLHVPTLLNATYPLSTAVEWYVGGCHDSQRPSFMGDTMKTAGLAVIAANKTVTTFSKHISSFCDGSGPSVYNSMLTISQGLNDLVDASGGVYSSLSSCETLNTYYATLTYDNACHMGMRASIEVFIYLFLVAFFSMVIVSFSVAWDQTDERLKSASTSPTSGSSPVDRNEDEIINSLFWKATLCCFL